jgi:hypothetical protein
MTTHAGCILPEFPPTIGVQKPFVLKKLEIPGIKEGQFVGGN